ncbi:ABC transporter permease [Streptomyces sp. SID8352]|uniref:ABC transporter permease n=1 Tax=Streptomyces sp. SID8352 TaxID=2690338 RepID=UPI00136E68C3|nr:ABC transporter permease [Streptomyces sp. SID8352]MYU26234.1 ABC transporter permease [Streptomyces sp. SID8352]
MTLLDRRAPGASGAVDGGARAVLALARFEARRLLLGVPHLIALAAYAAWIVWRTRSSWDGFPALQDVDRSTQSMPLLVGLAVLIGANHGVLRSRRHGTEDHFGSLVLAPGHRTAAHVLSVVPAALLVAVCVAAQFTWEALKPGAIGHGSPGELLVGPLTVLLLGIVGVLLGRLAPAPVAAPLLVVCALFGLGIGAFLPGGGNVDWLTPVVTEQSGSTLPSGLLGRPAAWHALYLAGLALCTGFLAVLIGGGRGTLVKAGVALSLVLTLIGVSGQSGEVPSRVVAARERASTAPEKEQKCVERGRTTYCAFAEWEPRVGDWAGVADRVRSLTGGSARERPLLVRQRIDARHGLEGDAALPPAGARDQVTVGTAWGGNRVPEFAAAVASVLVTGSEAEAGEVCDGRMVTVMWLALSWSDDPMDALRRVRLDDSVEGAAIVLSPTDPLTMTEGQTDVVRQLLERPEDAVAGKVTAHWAELTAPGVTTDRVARLLGVSGPGRGDACE